jgi:NADH-quinone oxidoreductase subunit L
VHALTAVCLLLFMGAMGKSAQFLLHTWLPDAMEGPTPVSALIHAATMVTAGVFMVARMSPLFELSQDALTVGDDRRTTAFFAATVGLVQNDIKRVIAYSTCSQLGYMFVALGVGAYSRHLPPVHPRLLQGAAVPWRRFGHPRGFRRAGHAPHGRAAETHPDDLLDDDHRHDRADRRGIPGTVIGTAGFFSKDAIIESAFVAHNPAAGYAFGLLVIAALFTSFYSWRLIFMTFHGKPRASADVMHHAHESPPVMLAPLFILAAGALLAGVLFKEYFFGHHYAEFWGAALFTLPDNTIVDEFHHVPLWVKLSPFVAMLVGLATAWYFYIRSPETPKRLAEDHRVLYLFLLNKWYFDELYDFIFVRPAKWLGSFLWKQGDGRVIDGFGPNGIAARVQDITGRVVKLQTGYLYHYAFVMLIGIAALVTWMMLGSAFR